MHPDTTIRCDRVETKEPSVTGAVHILGVDRQGLGNVLNA